MQNVIQGVKHTQHDPQSILFVTSQLRARELKMARGLSQLGWKVGLIYFKWTPFDPSEHFDFVVECASAVEAHEYAKALSPNICHVFSGAIDDFVLNFCRDKPSPVVIDLNDVFAPSLLDYCYERFEPTKEALALADGFCARDLQVKRAEKIDGFSLPRNIVLFPEYCWNTPSLADRLAPDAGSNEIHVVSVGTFSLETQGMYDSGYLQLVRMFVKQGIHFHIYPHWDYRKDHYGSPHVNFERDFADFLELERSSPYVHLHESLPIEKLAEVLPQYDFGIVSGGCAEFGQKLKFYKPAYLETCYSGRIADYLDARLPVLVNDEVTFDFWLLKRYGVCVDLKGVLRPGFKDELLAFKRGGQRQRVETAASALSIAENAPRLAKFYLNILGVGEAANMDINAGRLGASESADSPRAAKAIKPSPSSVIEFLAAATRARNIKSARKIAKRLLPYREIRLLENHAQSARTEWASAQQENAALRAEIDTLKKNYFSVQSQARGLDQHNESLRAAISELEVSRESLSSQIQKFEEHVTSLDALMEQLSCDKDVLSARVETAEKSNTTLRSLVQTLEHKKSELGAHVERLDLENAAFRARVADLEHDKVALRTRVSGLEQDKVALRSRVTSLGQDGEAFRKRIAELERDKGVFRTQLTDLGQDNAAFRAQVQDLEQDKAGLLEQLAGYEQDRAAVDVRIAAFEQDKAALLEALADLERDNEALRARTTALDGEKAGFVTHLEELENANATLLQRVSTSEQERTLALEQLSSLRNDHGTIAARAVELEALKTGLTTRITELEQANASLVQQVLVLEQDKAQTLGRVAQLEQDNATVHAQVAGFTARIAELEQANTSLIQQTVVLEQEKANHDARVAGLEQDKAAIREQVAGLEQDKLALRAQVAGLEQDKDAIRSQAVGLEQDKAGLRRQIETLENGVAEALAQLATLETEKSSQLAKLDALDQDNGGLRNQLDTLGQEKSNVLGQLSNLENEKADLLAHVARLQQEKTGALKQVSDLEQDKTVLHALVVRLEQEKTAVCAQVESLEQDKSAVLAQAAGLERNNTALKSQADELLQNNSALDTRVKGLETEVGALTQQVNVLSNEKLVRQQEVQWGKVSINEVAGALNWPEVLNDVERANGFMELARILGLFSGSTNITDNPSACWDALATKNYDQLLNSGYNNFKRTIGNNYFNFLVQKGDPQIQSVERLLAPAVLDQCRVAARSIPHDPTSPSTDQSSYNYFVLMLWEYLKTIDVKRYAEVIEEPAEGNPILVPSGGRMVSQDLANSLIEYYSMSESVAFKRIKTVLEIGGGYGRNAYVILALNPKIKVTLVDIPPALYVAQRYLSSVFKDRRVFKARNFTRYAEVREELEAASIVFLMPHQLALMPKKRFDLSMNISSLHEMGTEQVKWYFMQLRRLTSQYFYLKQWRSSNNCFDGVVLNQGDYPYPKNWRNIYSRPCSVQAEFFEALFEVSKP